MITDPISDLQTATYYERFAEDYARETLSISMQPYAKAFVDAVGTNGSVLDLGCGAGRDLVALKQAGLRPVGLDLSWGLSVIAHRESGCPVVRADMRKLPFRERLFGGVWAAASMLHLRRADFVTALKECHRILEPQGLLFTSMKLGTGEELDKRGRRFTYVTTMDWNTHLIEAGFQPMELFSDSTVNQIQRANGTLDRTWISSYSRAC